MSVKRRIVTDFAKKTRFCQKRYLTSPNFAFIISATSRDAVRRFWSNLPQPFDVGGFLATARRGVRFRLLFLFERSGKSAGRASAARSLFSSLFSFVWTAANAAFGGSAGNLGKIGKVAKRDAGKRGVFRTFSARRGASQTSLFEYNNED